MGEVRFIKPQEFEVVNGIAVRLDGLAGVLAFLEDVTGLCDGKRHSDWSKLSSMIGVLQKDAQSICEQIGDHL